MKSKSIITDELPQTDEEDELSDWEVLLNTFFVKKNIMLIFYVSVTLYPLFKKNYFYRE